MTGTGQSATPAQTMPPAWPVRSFPSLWIEAAAFERDRRAQNYPQRIASNPQDEDRLTGDYQAWCAIADWLERGSYRLIGGWGGTADPPAVAITWAYLEQRAKAALDSLETKIRKECDPATERTLDADQLAALRDRRYAVEGIHEVLVLQREMIERTHRAQACRGQGEHAAAEAAA